jgi:DNA-binding response OmpR family regulator
VTLACLYTSDSSTAIIRPAHPPLAVVPSPQWEVAIDENVLRTGVADGRFQQAAICITTPMVDYKALISDLRGLQPLIPLVALVPQEFMGRLRQGLLDSGADACLPLPIEDEGELEAQWRALHRRTEATTLTPGTLKLADMEVCFTSRRVVRQGQRVDLAPREFALLGCLMRPVGRICSPMELLREIWNSTDIANSNLVEVYIRRLRRKLDDNFDRPLIHTVRSQGYVLGENAPPKVRRPLPFAERVNVVLAS